MTFRLTFAPNGKSEFVPRDQVFPLFVLNCSLLPQKNYNFQIAVEPRYLELGQLEFPANSN